MSKKRKRTIHEAMITFLETGRPCDKDEFTPEEIREFKKKSQMAAENMHKARQAMFFTEAQWRAIGTGLRRTIKSNPHVGEKELKELIKKLPHQ